MSWEHGGDIVLANRKGGGLSVHLELPTGSGLSPPDEDGITPIGEARKSTLNIDRGDPGPVVMSLEAGSGSGAGCETVFSGAPRPPLPQRMMVRNTSLPRIHLAALSTMATNNTRMKHDWTRGTTDARSNPPVGILPLLEKSPDYASHSCVAT